MKSWQCELSWAQGRDCAYYENLGRHFAYFALKHDDEGKAEMAARMYQDAADMRRYELGLRKIAKPKPQRKHPPQSKANKRGELTKRQMEIWLIISDEYQTPTADSPWLGYVGADRFYIRPDAKISDAVLQALERKKLIEIAGACPHGTLFRIANPDKLPARRSVDTPRIDPTW